METWTYEGYWNAVLGADRDEAAVVEEFELDATDRQGLGEWLGSAEAEAAREGGIDIPAEWADHHARALAELQAAD